ncbi:NPCBM-associated, NEW3 domain of alpha-galactosidase [Chitinophaga sp. YR573]|uniref:COG1470 family protein n=1 Tax=Chitinophaga sp. YR573 TaxID=1881040 RepID=UPI0008C04A33|nr:NEW3 domain-containing protein [Chitinophaga sp. YR573]SEW37032.1 NPCBM-associated, NEW3 domain of alpha-galactosidase [Chitinophaga sp. YR573]
MSAKKQYPKRIKFNPLFCLFLLLLSKQSIAQKGTPPFTARLMNIEAAANTTFTYNTKLRNAASLPRIYQLSATIPPGWNIAFKAEGMQVTSLNIDSGRTQDITIEINPTIQTKPGKYAIPVVAAAGSDSIRLNLEAVVKGTYTVQLTTPSGRLSDDVTEGSRTEIHLLVKNTGTIALENLALTAQAPPQWETTFSPSTITKLEPGKDQEVIATLNVPDKTIAGDYVTTFSVRNNNSSSDAAFRMTVRTSVLTGWLGLLVILVALGVVYYLIRKYGRR